MQSEQKNKWPSDFVYTVDWQRVVLFTFNVCDWKTLMTQWPYIFLAGLFYFTTKTPSDQKNKWPSDFVYVSWLAESSPFLLLLLLLKYVTEKP
jgi:hypothetical protein